MYERFFGLRARPFGITPSRSLFFHGATQRRALASLRRQVQAGEPLIALTGPIGAGKTTLLQTLLAELPADRFQAASVSSTQLDDVELTRALLLAFGAPAAGESLEGLAEALRAHVASLRSQGRRGLVVVDEAQNLPAGTLRCLLELADTAADRDDASLQVIVSGQPTLRELLAEAAGPRAGEELFLCRLGPMGGADTAAYVQHRLSAVGTTGGPVFDAAALAQIHAETGGLPRLVNRLCDRVLLSACLDATRDIDAARVTRAASDLRDELGEEAPAEAVQRTAIEPPAEPARAAASPPTAPRAPSPPVVAPAARARRRWAGAATAVLIVASTIAWLALDRPSPPDTGTGSRRSATDVVTAEPAAVPTAPPVPRLPPAATAPPVAAAPPVPPPVAAAPDPPAEPTDARAALGLTTGPEPAIGRASAPAAAPPEAAPTGVPACTENARILGLCP